MHDTEFRLEPVRRVAAACRAAGPAKLVVGGGQLRHFLPASPAYLDAAYGVVVGLQHGRDVGRLSVTSAAP